MDQNSIQGFETTIMITYITYNIVFWTLLSVLDIFKRDLDLGQIKAAWHQIEWSVRMQSVACGSAWFSKECGLAEADQQFWRKNTRAKGLVTFKKQRNSKLEHMGRSATKEDRDDLTKRKSRPSRFGQVQEVSWKYGRPILESSLWSSVMLWCLSWPWSCNFAVGRCTFWVVLSTEKGLPEDSWSRKKKYNKRFKAKIWCLAGLNKRDAS